MLQLIYFHDCHPWAEKDAVKVGSSAFLNTLVKFMDMESNGSISKLSMYALCDTTIDKEDAYILCDSVWEILTGTPSLALRTHDFQKPSPVDVPLCVLSCCAVQGGPAPWAVRSSSTSSRCRR